MVTGNPAIARRCRTFRFAVVVCKRGANRELAMNDLGMRMAWTLGLLALALAAAPVAAVQYVVEPVVDVIDAPADGSQGFSQAELDQMLAPIALYPDSLLSQVLIAATYPLEIVAAARWSRQNPQLDGEEAVAAVADRDWDPSVKALVAFPELLARLDENLEWTRNLGDAMLFQEAQVMDSIQFLRARADAAGSLETPEFTRVIREERTIIIEPAVTRIVHVPFYDPWIVYGPWWRPLHPPFFWGPPTVFVHGHPGFFWSSGVRVSSGFFFSSFWWPSSSVIIVNNPRFHPPRHRPAWPHYVPGHRWKHSPVHRRGVHYRHPEVRQRYAAQAPVPRSSARWSGAQQPARELAERDDRGAYRGRQDDRGRQDGADLSSRNRPGAESGRPRFSAGNVPRGENREIGEHRPGRELRPGRESQVGVPGARSPGSASFAARPARPDPGTLERRISQSRNDRTASTANSHRSSQVSRPQAGQPSGTAFRAPQASNRDPITTRTQQRNSRNAVPTRTPQVINRNAAPVRTPQATRPQSTQRSASQVTQRSTSQAPQRSTSQAPTRQSQPQRSPAPSAAPAPASSSRASGAGQSNRGSASRGSASRSSESQGSGSSRQDSRGNSGRAGMSRDTRSHR
jgi:hypothetical protein